MFHATLASWVGGLDAELAVDLVIISSTNLVLAPFLPLSHH